MKNQIKSATRWLVLMLCAAFLLSFTAVLSGCGGTEKTVTRLHTVTSFMFNVRHGDTVVISYERDGIAAEARITYNKNSMFTLFA